MTKYGFINEQRFAVFVTYGEKCYMCRKPLAFDEMEVDHVLPESLVESPSRLAEVLELFGLDPSFDLNSFANWLPACRPCNLEKLQTVFEPTPLIQLELQRLKREASRAEKIAAEQVTSRALSKALAVLQKYGLPGSVPPAAKAEIQQFVEEWVSYREPEMRDQPLAITPLFKILQEANGVRLVQGPYGTGASPINPSSSYICSTCGFSGWNGARCVICGTMDDD